MIKYLLPAKLITLLVFIVDQSIKTIFVNGYEYHNIYFSLELHYNTGVAFSMFAFLGEYLKYIQIGILIFVIYYALQHKEILKKSIIPFAIFLGAGLSNVYDRFIHTGVVDYFYWHYWFDFAVFNLADVLINFSFLLFVIIYFVNFRKK
ncbi:MAG: Lipoprotein signal peptidase (EC [uncultured Campylobacterales bacterium]|uniref:Lipoprotein signal peptidase n=1 Tax=uncultured Campylobacterales bacterium TaxID=352960 RepID=A0A6S6SWJ2_9BACT|nr:MAG: Lipoprotein signal peptidase (EC [uncultured Campylobacterales bacterium]